MTLYLNTSLQNTAKEIKILTQAHLGQDGAWIAHQFSHRLNKLFGLKQSDTLSGNLQSIPLDGLTALSQTYLKRIS